MSNSPDATKRQTLLPEHAERLRRNPPLILNCAESAIYLGISERCLRDLLASHRIRSVRIGRRVVVRLDDINEYLGGAR